MLSPLNCQRYYDSDEEDNRIVHPTSIASTVKTTVTSETLQRASSFSNSSATSRTVNVPIESMEGHSSLASYSHHHQPQLHHQQHPSQLPPPNPHHHEQGFQSPPSGSNPYYQQQQHSYGEAGSSSGGQPMTSYGRDYGQHNQVPSTSSGQQPPQQYHNQQGQSSHYDPQQTQHTVRYEQLPSSAPPQQRSFVPQYPVKVVDAAQTYAQVNRSMSVSSSNSKPLPPSAPHSTPPSAPPVMTPRKTPPSFLKRQPDAQEQQRVDYEVARNVSQIMSKNGMKVTQTPEPSPTKSLPPLAPLPPPKSAVYQCPNCNRNLANARNLQRHRQTCGASQIPSASLSQQQGPKQQNAPQLAAMLQRSPPAPCASAPPPQAPSTSSSFQHHNSTGNLGMSFQSSSSSQHHNTLYSPQDMLMGDPNVMLSDGFDFKEDPMLYQGPSGTTDNLWSRDDSFHSEPQSASHDQVEMSDPLGFHDSLNDPLAHHMDSFNSDNQKETPRDFHESDELTTLDPNPQCPNQYFGMGIDPELDIPLSLDVDEPLMRSESASLSSSSQGRNTPANGFTCESCKKTVSSERSLRRHHNTCKAYQAEYANSGEEKPPVVAKRKPAANGGGKRGKKMKEPEPQEAKVPEKNSAILAALRKEPTPPTQHFPHLAHQHPNYHQPNYQMMMMPQSQPTPSSHFQVPYQPPGGPLPSISASWLSNNNHGPEGSSMFPPSVTPTSSSNQFQQPPTPTQKSSPLEDLLNEEDGAADDGDSRSSSGTSSAKPPGNPLFTCEHCSKQLCSMSNLKRHRATCKAAAGQSMSTSASSSSSQPATPAPSQNPSSLPPVTVPAPQAVSSNQPSSLETTATVTYTKTNVSGGTNTWSNDNGQLVSPKPKSQSTAHAMVTHSDSTDGNGHPHGKSFMTVGEALRAQQHQQRQAQFDQQQQQIQMQYQQRFQQQIPQQAGRIPPRPPNPILNQVQNPPQQVQQNQMQNQMHNQIPNQPQMPMQNPALHQTHDPMQNQMPSQNQGLPPNQMTQMTNQQQNTSSSQMQNSQNRSQNQKQMTNMAPVLSRQAPSSQHQIVHQQLPPLRLQSPPAKKGLIEHKNTELVLITSEPLAEKRSQHPQYPQHQESFNIPQQPPPHGQMDQKRRSSDGHLVQPLPPIQLPQRPRQPQQSQQPPQPQHHPVQQSQLQQNSQTAYPAQFNGRPLPPLQLSPHPNQSQHQQQQQHQMVHQQLDPMNQMNIQPPQPLQHQQIQQVQQMSVKRGRTQNAVSKMDSHGGMRNEETAQPPGSPLDSIITSVPLSIEVHHHTMKTGPLEQGQSSAESHSTAEPSPRKAHHQQAYICPECERIYSCRKNVKRHRMAVHKLSLDEILAKPEQPAPDAPPGTLNGGGRRHTVAGLESGPKKENGAGGNNSGMKRKASAAVTPSTATKKGKEMAASVEIAKPTIEESAAVERQEPPSTPVVNTTAPLALPPAHTILSHHPPSTVTPNQSSVPQQQPVQQHNVQMQLNKESNGNMPHNPYQQLGQQIIPASQTPMNVQVAQPPPPPQSLNHPKAPVQVCAPPAAPLVAPPAPRQQPPPKPSMAQSLPPLQLPPLQDASSSHIPKPSPSWNSLAMPNSAPPTNSSVSLAISINRTTRSSEFSDEEDTKAMAKIAAELKRSAEDWPVLAVIEGVARPPGNGEDIDEDELLIKRLRQGGILEDVGDVADILLSGQEADSTFVDDMMDRAMNHVPPLSTASSVGLPSLSSPDEQYLQHQHLQHQQHHQQQQMHYQQYHQQQVWNEGYQQQYHHQDYIQEHQVQQQSHMIQVQVSNNNNHQQMFQEPMLLQRPASQPAPPQLMKAGRRPSTVPKQPTDLQCSGCKKILGSEYSLRRHRGGCADVQQALNPEYPRPPQRRAARRAAKLNEAEILASLPKPMDPQLLAERRAAAAEAVVERMEALPPPLAVHEVVNQVRSENMMKKEQTPSPALGAPVAVAPDASSSSSSSKSNSSVPEGVQQELRQ